MHYAHITLSSIASLVLDRLLFQLRSASFLSVQQIVCYSHAILF